MMKSSLQGSGGLIFELADEWWKDGEGSFLASETQWGQKSIHLCERNRTLTEENPVLQCLPFTHHILSISEYFLL